MTQSYNPDIAVTISVWATPLSLAATQGIDLSLFSSAYLDVSVQRVCLPCGMTRHRAGLPHSEITGSILVCKSPVLIAAYHVLRRLQEPRHPPYALIHFLTYCSVPRLLHVAAQSPYLILNHVNEPNTFRYSQINKPSRLFIFYIAPLFGHGWRISDSNR